MAEKRLPNAGIWALEQAIAIRATAHLPEEPTETAKRILMWVAEYPAKHEAVARSALEQSMRVRMGGDTLAPVLRRADAFYSFAMSNEKTPREPAQPVSKSSPGTSG